MGKDKENALRDTDKKFPCVMRSVKDVKAVDLLAIGKAVTGQ